MTVSVVSVSARGKDEVSVAFEIRQGEAVQGESFLLSASELADLRISVGECDRETFDAVSAAAQRYAALRTGLSILSYGAYSKRALCRKLLQRGISRDRAAEAIAALTELGYVDESADAYREAQRAVAKLWGKKRIYAHLLEKGYTDEVVRGAMYALEDDGVDFFELCERRLRQKGGDMPQDPKERERLIASLMRYGFSTSEIKTAMRRISEDN